MTTIPRDELDRIRERASRVDRFLWNNDRINFVEHAFTDIPRLLAHIEAVEGERDRLAKALEKISGEGREDGEGVELATSGSNYDDTYWEGCKHGAFVAGEIARTALAEREFDQSERCPYCKNNPDKYPDGECQHGFIF